MTSARAAWFRSSTRRRCPALGKGLERTGKLNAEGRKEALINIRRFVALTRAMNVTDVEMLATAAVRDAKDGKDFAKEIERATGVAVRVISGEEEARLSALGVLAGVPEADGLMGDLGGGSLELVLLNKGKIAQQVTLPIGPLRLVEATDGDLDAAQKIIDRQLEELDWLEEVKGRTFYPVGGTWRTLAKHPHGPDALSAACDPRIPDRPPLRGRSGAGGEPSRQAQPDVARRHLQAPHRRAALRRADHGTAAARGQAGPDAVLRLRPARRLPVRQAQCRRPGGRPAAGRLRRLRRPRWPVRLDQRCDRQLDLAAVLGRRRSARAAARGGVPAVRPRLARASRLSLGAGLHARAAHAGRRHRSRRARDPGAGHGDPLRRRPRRDSTMPTRSCRW